MIDFGTIHWVENGFRYDTYDIHPKIPENVFFAEAMFYYCLKILGLAGAKRLSCSEVNHAIWLKKRRQKSRRILGSLYSFGGDDVKNETQKSLFESKYKHIPLLIEDVDLDDDGRYHYRFIFNKMNRDSQYGDLILSSHYDDIEQSFQAVIGRILILRGLTQSSGSFIENAMRRPNIRVVKWFVTNGNDSSLHDFFTSVRYYTIPHVLVRKRCFASEEWNLTEDSAYYEAVKKSLVVSYPKFNDVDPSNDMDEEILSCFASSGQFENLVEFSKEFKLGDFGKPSTSRNDGNRFASLWD